MPTPQHSIVFWAPPVGSSGSIAVGDVLIPSATEPGAWVVATSANRAGRGAEGVAISVSGGSGLGSVEIQQTGTLDATSTGLGPGSRSLVKTSATGRLERVATPQAGDDVIGYAEASGRVHLLIGLPWAEIVALTGSGEANTTSNAGAGVGLAKAKVGADLPFKTLLAGANVTLTSAADTVTIASAAGTGEANTASNVGTGDGLVFKGKAGVNLEFKRIAAGANVTVSNGSNDVTISAASPGEANTASNVGAGAGTLFKQKTGVNLEFKTLEAGSNITLTNNADTVTIASTSGGFTAGGDLSGSSTNQTVVGVRQTTIGTAGGSHPTGRVLRTTGTTTADWGALDLSSSNARTGTLPIANGGTGVTALPGASGNPLINNSSALGAATNWTFGVNGLAGGASSFLSIGTSATTGDLRLPSTGTIKVRNSANTADLTFATCDGAALATVTVGESGVGNVFLSAAAGGTTGLWSGRHRFGNSAINTEWVSIDATELNTRVPIRGMSSANSPFGSDGSTSVSVVAGATYTLSNLEYRQKIIEIRIVGTAGARTVAFPSTTSTDGYSKHLVIDNQLDGIVTLTLSIAGGGTSATVTVPAMSKRSVTVAVVAAVMQLIGAIGNVSSQ